MTSANTPASGVDGAARAAPPLMRPAPSARRRVVLIVAVTAFLSWLGYLAVLATTTRHPIVLSRPQLLVSNLVVIAQLAGGAEHPDAMATVAEIVWSSAPAEQVKANARFVVSNLDRVNGDRGWAGPGKYILALTQLRDGGLRVTPIPSSPGYPATATQQADRVRIYPADPSTREQLADIERQYHRQ